ncbi:hypothetical protein BDR26DRAFT_870142 [Obelidium mucronatum]|nr:hypothetical protein BDR26DRAFT_870142 [Obelidium mucronatum]
MSAPSPHLGLSAAYGAAAWFAAATYIRFNRPLVQSPSVALFAVLVPVSWAGTYGLRWLGFKKRDHLIAGYSVATATATVLDAVAMLWFPELYGGALENGVVGATVLWGAGWGLFASVFA